MMSLGAGALEVSWGPNANSREEVSMETLEAAPPLKQPLTNTVTLNKEILTHDNTYLRERGNLENGNNPPPPSRREEREQESVTICRSKVDPLRSTSKATFIFYTFILLFSHIKKDFAEVY